MYYFADIDENGVCKTISGYGKPRENTVSQVPIETHDVSIIGKRWNGAAWEEYEPELPYQPTEQEITQAKLDYLLMMQE